VCVCVSVVCVWCVCMCVLFMCGVCGVCVCVTGYYSFTLGIKKIPNDWDYRENIFRKLQTIKIDDVLEWASKNEFSLQREIDIKEVDCKT